MKTTPRAYLTALAVVCGLTGCATHRSEAAGAASASAVSASPASSVTHIGNTPSPQQIFFASLRAECGKAFAGRVVADQPAPMGEDPFAGKLLVMHVRECSDTELRIPFHVGEDRSRTWVITRTPAGLRLKHDHRHEDGSEDVLTQYGGNTTDAGTTRRQAFPVDAESIALFKREQRGASVTNTWSMEIEHGRVFAYQLSRPGGRLFRVEFNLAEQVAVPPPPWSPEPLR